jgi:nucleoside phosphorylase
VYDWDYGKWKKSKPNLPSTFHSRPDPISTRDLTIHRDLRDFISKGTADKLRIFEDLSGLNLLNTTKSPEYFLAPAASGSAVVGSEEIIGRITNINDSIVAVDMESYGIYTAAKTTNVVKPQFLCVKSVSDYCDGTKNDRWHTSCCNLSAIVTSRLLRRWVAF